MHRSHSLRISPVLVVWFLSFLVIPLGAALSFLIQPIFAKILLPRLGGTAATWLGASLFFQLALLLGYFWGVWMSRLRLRWQFFCMAGLTILAVLTFSSPDGLEGAPTIISVILTLAKACLPGLVLLFSLSPWLHSWRERLDMSEPYALYAVSNVGSLLALLCYPLIIETNFGLSDQLAVWRSLGVFVCACFLAGLISLAWSLRKAPDLPASQERRPRPNFASWCLWIFMSALTCATMLAASQLVAVEIGSVPIAWVGPLGVYLASFSLTFAGRWRSWMTGLSIIVLLVSLLIYMATKGFSSATMDSHRLVWLLLTCGAAALVGNALLYETRPARGGAWFYLAIALGGALGGFTTLWLIPLIFPYPKEFALGAAFILASGFFWACKWQHYGGLMACFIVALAPVLIMGWQRAHDSQFSDLRVSHYRDIYGHIMIERGEHSVVISSSTTLHGSQLFDTEQNRRRPTQYYTESGALGRTMQRLQQQRPQMRVAIVGLGAGTAAAYARKDDEFVFYDIDPKIETIARDYFKYLEDSLGSVQVELVDGRRALSKSDENFDLIMIDAFMGDGIPAHLLTREAIGTYAARLQARDGVLLVHASLRYSRLFPVVGATAAVVGLESLEVSTQIDYGTEYGDLDKANSVYIVIGGRSQARNFMEWFPETEDSGRVHRKLEKFMAHVLQPQHIWTDDRQSALDALFLQKYLGL
jgi:spermidine synthase